MPGAGTSRSATMLVGAAVACGLGLLVGTTGATGGPLAMAAAGCLLGVAVSLRAPDAPGGVLETTLASILTPTVAMLATAGVGLAALDAGLVEFVSGGGSADPGALLRSLLTHAGVALAAGMGTFGVVGTLRDGIGDGAVTRTALSAYATLFVIWLGLAVVLVPRLRSLADLPVPAVALDPIVDPLLAPGTLDVGLLTFGLLTAVLCKSAALALGRLPIVELTGRSRRDRVRAILADVDAHLGRGFIGGILLAGASVVLLATGTLPELFATVPGSRAVAVSLSAPGLRSALAALLGVLWCVVLASALLQWLTGSVTELLGLVVPSLAAGLLAIAAALLAAPLVARPGEYLPGPVPSDVEAVIRLLTPTGAVLTAMGFVLFGLAAVLTAFALARAFGYVPSRAAAGAVAAAGLVVGAVAVGVAGGPPLAVFGAVAAAILAWDASERGVETRAELGPRATARIEVVHALGSLAVAAVGVAVAWLALSNLDALAVADVPVLGALAAVGGTVVLLSVIRG